MRYQLKQRDVHSVLVLSVSNKYMNIIIKLLIIIILGFVLVFGYLGFLPVVSPLMGATTPKDLGVRFEESDFKSYTEKAKIKFEALGSDLSPEKSLSFEGKSELEVSFTSEEMTAMINSDKWKYYPVSDVQVKVHDDGTAEISGVLRKDRLQGYLQAQGVSLKEVDAIMGYIKDVPLNPIFYAKGTGSVVNDKVDMKIERAEIGRLSIPTEFISDPSPIEGFIEERIKFVPNFHVESFGFKDGKMDFKGTYPEVQYNSER